MIEMIEMIEIITKNCKSNGRLTRVARLHYMSRDHPIAHKFTYHILQPSPAPALLSAQAPGHASRQERGMVPVSPVPESPVPGNIRNNRNN